MKSINLFRKLEQIESEELDINEKMLREIKKTNKLLKRNNSYTLAFARGIFIGVGTFLGATIVVGLLLGVMSQIIDISKQVDVFKNLLDRIQIEKAIKDAETGK